MKSLYTNVSFKEAIIKAADKLYADKFGMSPVDKETFIFLAEVATTNALILTHDGPLFKKRRENQYCFRGAE